MSKVVLFKLISDSERHKSILERIAKDPGFELGDVIDEFSFSDKRIFNEIYGLELTTKSLYEQITANFGDILVKRLPYLEKWPKKRRCMEGSLKGSLTEPLGFSKF